MIVLIGILFFIALFALAIYLQKFPVMNIINFVLFLTIGILLAVFGTLLGMSISEGGYFGTFFSFSIFGIALIILAKPVKNGKRWPFYALFAVAAILVAIYFWQDIAFNYRTKILHK